MAKPRVLIIEDNEKLLRTYRGFLRETGYEVAAAMSASSARLMFNEFEPTLALMDVRLPDGDGIALLREWRAAGARIPIAVITAHGGEDVAAEALSNGADDFLNKPFSGERLRVTLRNLIAKTEAERELAIIQEAVARPEFEGMIGASPAMQAVYRVIESAASSKATVFITGESGTGKELAALAVHRRSPRRHKPFIAINCGAIPADLMESELFGHIKGAFTGAVQDRPGAARSADGGTLFLDEIGEMELNLQSKLLRFLQTGEVTPVGSHDAISVDVRILCATNRSPMAEVRAKRFREDLYYRLHVIPLHLPPLRERGQDVLAIAHALFAKFAEQEGKAFDGLDETVETVLLRHTWPGNVRELENVVRKTVVMSPGKLVDTGMIETSVPASEEENAPRPASTSGLADLAKQIRPLATVERQVIEEAIGLCAGDVRKAAVFLEISPATIYRKQQKWAKSPS